MICSVEGITFRPGEKQYRLCELRRVPLPDGVIVGVLGDDQLGRHRSQDARMRCAAIAAFEASDEVFIMPTTPIRAPRILLRDRCSRLR